MSCAVHTLWCGDGEAGMQRDMKQVFAIAGMALLGACASQSAPGLDADWILSPTFGGVAAPVPAPGCPPAGWDRAKLDALKAAEFEIADVGERQAFAKGITACLASPDPALRDGIAFEALTHMLRGKQLDDTTKRALLVDLEARLEAADPQGFGQPFAALALSEVARADRIEAFLTEQERVELLVKAQHWFINIKDYRGFDEHDGWRHAVAHGSDLLMQLALNPKVDEEGLRVIISAVGMQVAPESHAYIHGESERLARPILYAAARGALSEQEWAEWLAAIATPKNPDKMFASEAGLNWRNNVMAFLESLYVNVVIGSDAKDDVLRPGLEAALKAMP